MPFNKAVLLQTNNLNLFKASSSKYPHTEAQGQKENQGKEQPAGHTNNKIQDKETASSINTISKGKKEGELRIDAKLWCEHISVSGSHLKSVQINKKFMDHQESLNTTDIRYWGIRHLCFQKKISLLFEINTKICIEEFFGSCTAKPESASKKIRVVAK